MSEVQKNLRFSFTVISPSLSSSFSSLFFFLSTSKLHTHFVSLVFLVFLIQSVSHSVSTSQVHYVLSLLLVNSLSLNPFLTQLPKFLSTICCATQHKIFFEIFQICWYLPRKNIQFSSQIFQSYLNNFKRFHLKNDLYIIV